MYKVLRYFLFMLSPEVAHWITLSFLNILNFQIQNLKNDLKKKSIKLMTTLNHYPKGSNPKSRLSNRIAWGAQFINSLR